MTAKQFNELEDKVKNYKADLDSSLKKLLEEMPSPSRETFDNVKEKGSIFFTEFESFIVSLSSEYSSLSQTQINDILTSIENILEFSIIYWNTIQKILNTGLEQTFKPQNNFLKTTQGTFRTYRKREALLLQNKFKENNLPIEGFLSKEKYKLKSSKIDWLSIIIGIALLIITGIIIFIVYIDTGMQYWLTRIFGALGVAFLITGVSKQSIQAKINIPTAAITATGAIAIFFMLYFANPAEQPKYNNALQSRNISNK